jgi:hypothetical protein
MTDNLKIVTRYTGSKDHRRSVYFIKRIYNYELKLRR